MTTTVKEEDTPPSHCPSLQVISKSAADAAVATETEISKSANDAADVVADVETLSIGGQRTLSSTVRIWIPLSWRRRNSRGGTPTVGSDGYAAVGSAVLIPIMSRVWLPAVVRFQQSLCSLQHLCRGLLLRCQLGGAYIQTSSFFFYCTVVSVICQFFTMISIGALADHGSYRKTFLLGFSILFGYPYCPLRHVLSDSLWGYAALLYVLSSIAYSVASVFANAYIPMFARVHPDVVALRASGASNRAVNTEMDKVSNNLSSRGYFWAYAAGVVELIFAGVFGSQVAVAFAGVWWCVFMIPTIRDLRVRPGPALPKGEKNYILFSWKRFGKTLLKARKLRQMIIFLIACSSSLMLLRDTIIQVAVLFASNEIKMSSVELLIVATLVPFAAGIGCIFWNWIQHRFHLTSRVTLMIVAVLYSLLPLWGIVGIYSTSIGLRSKLEVYILGVYHGFFLGAAQATCRSMFAEICPPGYESEFFSLYAITDKGSSWVGPLIVAAIGDATGSRRPSFWFLFVAFLLPIVFFYYVDVRKARFEIAAF
ncbi:vacuole effluxer Atg22 like-domain-containing protein [Chytridium lagenaria]|nr:vacuole effluxer Atg22 like-domain-containing protein [Chytridium lagenaria]